MEQSESDTESQKGGGGGGGEIFDERMYKQIYDKKLGATQLFRLKRVLIAFLDATKMETVTVCWKKVFNCMVRRKTAGYTHSEFAFVVENQTTLQERWIACSIRVGQLMTMDFKDYSNELWKVYTLIMTPTEISQLWDECVVDVSQHIRYNNAVYWNFITPSACCAIDRRGREAWCSEHNVYKFQHLRWPEFNNVEPYLTDPYTLLKILKYHGRLAIGNLPPKQADSELEFSLAGLFERTDIMFHEW